MLCSFRRGVATSRLLVSLGVATLLEGQGQFVPGQFVAVLLTNALTNALAWFVGSVAR